LSQNRGQDRRRVRAARGGARGRLAEDDTAAVESDSERAARRDRRYAGAKAAEQAERAEWARQARAEERPNLHGNMGGGGYGGGG
jgi:hypothetical protein